MRGTVGHWRVGKTKHRFSYRVYGLLVDLDELETHAAKCRWFSHNRFNLLSFYDRDHGSRDGQGLCSWATKLLARYDIDSDNARIQLLCFPRVLGYVFNPLSIWLCTRGTELLGVIWQVHNTFGDHHFYVTHNHGQALPQPLSANATKQLHVSPFMPRTGEYDFRLQVDDNNIDYRIEYRLQGKPALVARHQASGCDLSDKNIVLTALTHPLLTLKVIVGIHWEALRIFLKGSRFHTRPTPVEEDTTSCTLN